MKIILDKKLRILILGALALVTYFTIVVSTTIVNPDAQFIIPILKQSSSISDYLNKLLSFQTLDVQPVRDLSLYIDMKLYEVFKFDLSIAHNLTLWLFACFIVDRIIEKQFRSLSSLERFLIVVCFMAYPLFTQAISWGVARKHILAFVFTLLATDRLINKEGEFALKDAFLINLYYLGAIYSQPIALLWPLWACLYIFMLKRSVLRSSFIVLAPALVIFALTAYINVLYYESSPVFLNSYGSKTNEFFEFSDKSLALGHYIFQLFFPYILSFTYTLGHWSTLAGLGILGLFSYLLLGLKVDRKLAFVWASFLLFPICIVITKSTMLYDTYLLIPAFGLLMLLLQIKEKLPSVSYKNGIYLMLIIGWMGFSHYESMGWRDEIVLTEKNFERRPTCATAFQYLRMSYENDRPPESPVAKKYLYENECEKSGLSGLDLLNMQAYLLYYENDFPVNERIAKLKNISTRGIFPHMAYASIYVKLNKTGEAAEVIHELVQKWGNQRFKNEFIPLAAKVLEPFCHKQGDEACLRVLQPFVSQKTGISYK